jgi:hypothetical protein
MRGSLTEEILLLASGVANRHDIHFSAALIIVDAVVPLGYASQSWLELVSPPPNSWLGRKEWKLVSDALDQTLGALSAITLADI